MDKKESKLVELQKFKAPIIGEGETIKDYKKRCKDDYNLYLKKSGINVSDIGFIVIRALDYEGDGKTYNKFIGLCAREKGSSAETAEYIVLPMGPDQKVESIIYNSNNNIVTTETNSMYNNSENKIIGFVPADDKDNSVSDLFKRAFNIQDKTLYENLINRIKSKDNTNEIKDVYDFVGRLDFQKGKISASDLIYYTVFLNDKLMEKTELAKKYGRYSNVSNIDDIGEVHTVEASKRTITTERQK